MQFLIETQTLLRLQHLSQFIIHFFLNSPRHKGIIQALLNKDSEKALNHYVNDQKFEFAGIPICLLKGKIADNNNI